MNNINKNKLVIGDSLDVLRSMAESNEKYDIIMIDPPYNENKSAGKYQDQWKGEGKDFVWAGQTHGEYLDFLYPRISAGSKVLSDKGIMMLFIGDGEYPFIRVLMEKEFGLENYIGTVIWDSSANQQKSKPLDRNHEYVLMFVKDINQFPGLYSIDLDSLNSKLHEYAQSLKEICFSAAEKKYLNFYKKTKKENKNNKTIGNFKYIYPQSLVPFYAGDAGDPRKGSQRQLLHPITNQPCPIPRNGKGWAFSEEYLEKIATSNNKHILHDGRVLVAEAHPKMVDIAGILFGKDHLGVPNTCRLYSLKTDKKVLQTTGHRYVSNNKKEGISPNLGFETVKPIDFLELLIRNYPDNSARIIDYFAGSGTTALAVDKANQMDSGTRSWTLVELNETTAKNIIEKRLSHFGIKSDENYLIFKKS